MCLYSRASCVSIPVLRVSLFPCFVCLYSRAVCLYSRAHVSLFPCSCVSIPVLMCLYSRAHVSLFPCLFWTIVCENSQFAKQKDLVCKVLAHVQLSLNRPQN
jgi:hypothetical protein